MRVGHTGILRAMSDPSPAKAVRPRSSPAPLPDFCSLPVLFVLLVVGALTVTVMWLAPGSRGQFSDYSVAILFVVWLAMLATVALCKLRPGFSRLPGLMPYAAVWLLLVSLVLIASGIVSWLDHALALGLTPDSGPRFVRDCGLVTALLAAGLLRYFYVVAQWQVRVAAVARAQVNALQARIRPHFLFNSMNTVAALVRVDPAAAERTVENLAELFRAALGSDLEQLGTLGEELLLVDRYLAIEQLRLGDRLHIERDLADLPADFPLPHLLLQPLVENAVRHGIQPSLEGGSIGLRGRRVDNGVEIVIDNPLPVTPAVGGNGHGVQNVRQRIAYHFGPRAKVSAVAQDARFIVTLLLPEPTSAHPDRR
jgi:two-component system sensor histidine kinase AlgZ